MERDGARGDEAARRRIWKWTQAKWYVGPEGKPIDLKIRALYVDTRLKEYTTGVPHEVTDRLFGYGECFVLTICCPQRPTRPRAGFGSGAAG